MLTIRMFATAVDTFLLQHCTETDARFVANYLVPGEPLVKFDSSCYVHRPEGGQLGHLTTKNDLFFFESQTPEIDSFSTSVAVNQWHWTNLEDAECQVALALMKQGVI